MYPPKHHQNNSMDHLIRTIQQFPLATIISANGEDCLTTHIPLIYRKTDTGYGKLVGHLDKNNPQCTFLDNRKLYVIFSGPDTYISPNTYTTTQLPTWNYIKVHAEGICFINNDPDFIKESMIEMTRFLETSDNPFVLESDHPRMDQLIQYVTGIEIHINRLEGKFKLSQDKIPADTKNAKEKLIADSQKSLRDFIESIS